MKLKAATIITLTALLSWGLLAGCALITSNTTAKELPVPAPGPQIKAGLKAVMPPVKDLRFWPSAEAGAANPNVRIFPQQVYAEAKKGLLASGLFAALPAPDEPAAAALKDKFQLSVLAFAINKSGSNPWAAPAYIIDGLVLPVYVAANLSTKGQMDLGSYLLPSTKVATSINAQAAYYVPGLEKPVMNLFYLEQVELGSVSERRLWQDLSNQRGFGTTVGKNEGAKVLQKLVQAISRDPHWHYLDQFERVARADAIVLSQAKHEERLQGAIRAAALLRPLPYSPAEIKIILDSILTPAARAALFNEVRARALGLSGGDVLPASQRLDAKKVEALFDDPALGRAQVEAEIMARVLAMVVSSLNPLPPPKPEATATAPGQPPAAAPAAPAPKPAAEEKPKPLPPLTPQAQRLSAELRQAVVAALKGQPQLQAVLLNEADKSVGPAWEPTKTLLQGLAEAPLVKTYLARRGS